MEYDTAPTVGSLVVLSKRAGQRSTLADSSDRRGRKVYAGQVMLVLSNGEELSPDPTSASLQYVTVRVLHSSGDTGWLYRYEVAPYEAEDSSTRPAPSDDPRELAR